MTSEQLQEQLSATWCREQSADDAHDAIWGEPFEGYTVRISDIARIIDNPDPEGMVIRLREILFHNDRTLATQPAPQDSDSK